VGGAVKRGAVGIAGNSDRLNGTTANRQDAKVVGHLKRGAWRLIGYLYLISKALTDRRCACVMPAHTCIHDFAWGTKEVVDAGLRRHDGEGIADASIIRIPGISAAGQNYLAGEPRVSNSSGVTTMARTSISLKSST
jgi:hypothetical protein